MGVLATVLLHVLVFVVCFRIFITQPIILPLMEIEVLVEPEQVEIKSEQFEIKPLVTGQKVEETLVEPTEKSDIDEQGDVEVPVEKPVEIDKRSLFRSDDVGKTADVASGNRVDSRGLFSGDNEPSAAPTDEVPSYNLDGRSIKGKLEQPANTSNREGRVVVEITVNQQGHVTKARTRAHGTTIQDAVLWEAAAEAARKTLFNTDFSSPALQIGTITYVFRLK